MPQQAIQILVPLEGRRAATEEEGGGDWVLIMPLGKWVAHHFPAEGPYEITADDLQQLVAHHDQGLPPIGIPGNEGHARGPAVGWLQELKATDEGLEARITWTALGQRYLDEGLYRYLSPEWFDEQWPYIVSSTGDKVPWVLSGFALTNDPFFTELPALAERRPNGMVIYAPLTAIWEEKPNEIWHRVRDPDDFLADTFRRKQLEPSAVRSVDVDFEITDAMAAGVAMVLGKLKPDKIPEDHDPDSMVLQAMRFTRETEEQDGWTLEHAKAWFAASTFAKGEAAMAQEQTSSDRTAELEQQLADERAAKQAAEKEAMELRAKEQQAQIRARLTALKAGNRVLAPAYIEKAVALIGAAKEKDPEALTADLADLIEKGLVEVGERGGVGAPRPLLGEAQKAINAAFGVTEEEFLAVYPQG